MGKKLPANDTLMNAEAAKFDSTGESFISKLRIVQKYHQKAIKKLR